MGGGAESFYCQTQPFVEVRLGLWQNPLCSILLPQSSFIQPQYFIFSFSFSILSQNYGIFDSKCPQNSVISATTTTTTFSRSGMNWIECFIAWVTKCNISFAMINVSIKPWRRLFYSKLLQFCTVAYQLKIEMIKEQLRNCNLERKTMKHGPSRIQKLRQCTIWKVNLQIWSV